MTYDVMRIAEYIITFFSHKEMPVTHLKLQKLLYFVWVDYCRKTRAKLYTEEMGAWQLGPVVPSVYYEYCVYGAMPICREYKSEIRSEDKQIIDATLEQYKDRSAFDLVAETHKDGTAWSRVFNEEGVRASIPFELIVQCEGIQGGFKN